jgi:alpha-beta hydrolase superfamily lysophospholipase
MSHQQSTSNSPPTPGQQQSTLKWPPTPADGPVGDRACIEVPHLRLITISLPCVGKRHMLDVEIAYRRHDPPPSMPEHQNKLSVVHLHGIGDYSYSGDVLAATLAAAGHVVIVPDLIGHGATHLPTNTTASDFDWTGVGQAGVAMVLVKALERADTVIRRVASRGVDGGDSGDVGGGGGGVVDSVGSDGSGDTVVADAPLCGPYIISGHSHGGALAVHFAALDALDAPRRVSKLMLWAPAGLMDTNFCKMPSLNIARRWLPRKTLLKMTASKFNPAYMRDIYR